MLPTLKKFLVLNYFPYQSGLNLQTTLQLSFGNWIFKMQAYGLYVSKK